MRILQVKYYDGNSVSVYPHRDQGQAGANWWPSVEHGWEKDSLQAIHTLLLKTCVAIGVAWLPI